MRTMATLVTLLALLLAAALAAGRGAARSRADLTFINHGDTNTLDLHRMSWLQDLRIGRCLFEGLVRYDVLGRDCPIVPAAAESWTVSPDGRTYTFRIRPDARWSNGDPVTADDFIFSWRRAMLAEVGCDYLKQFQVIRGGTAFVTWREAYLKDVAAGAADAAQAWDLTVSRFSQLVGLRVEDEQRRVLVVELERPTPYFLDLCAFAVFYPLYGPTLSQFESSDPATGRLRMNTAWTKPGSLVGNGPYRLVDWSYRRMMRLEANEFHWNVANLKARTIDIPSVADGNAEVLAFDTGAVDLLTDVTPAYRADMLAARDECLAEHRTKVDAWRAEGVDEIEIVRRLPPDPRLRIHSFPAFGTYFYSINCRPALPDGRANPFADARVRQAFTMAIDKQRITDTVRRIGERTASVLIPPGSLPDYDSPVGLAHDVARARELLADAGYPQGRGFITVELMFNKEGGHDLIAQAVAQDWERNLGVQVTLKQKDIKAFRADLRSHNFMIGRGSWFGDYADPTAFLEAHRTGDGNNDRDFSNSQFDDLLDQAAVEHDPARRYDILERAEALLMDEQVPVIPIFHYAQLCLFDAHRVRGVSSHPRQEQNMFLLEVAPTQNSGAAPGRTR